MRAASLVALVSIAIALAACSSSGDKSDSLCSDVNSLQSSVQQLKDVDVVKNGTSALQSALDKVKQSAAKVHDSAKSEFKSQTDALQTAITSLTTALKNVPANGLAPVQQAAQSVKTASTDLQNAIKSKKCT
jgi:outer membrane murein-binding lipoprotein Lpp